MILFEDNSSIPVSGPTSKIEDFPLLVTMVTKANSEGESFQLWNSNKNLIGLQTLPYAMQKNVLSHTKNDEQAAKCLIVFRVAACVV